MCVWRGCTLVAGIKGPCGCGQVGQWLVCLEQMGRSPGVGHVGNAYSEVDEDAGKA